MAIQYGSRVFACARHILIPQTTLFSRGLKTAATANTVTKITTRPGKAVPPFAFAFDIDGVLLRSSSPLPGAREALLQLQNKRIPFVLLTNGGGKTEQARVEQISKLLDVPLDTNVLIQSHTPYSELIKSVDKASPILVVGGEGDKCREVAESYGFENVIIPSDIFHAKPEIWPFSAHFAEYHAKAARPLPLPIFDSQQAQDGPIEGKHLRIDTVFVYNDPRDMGLDMQILIDLMLSSKGFLGTRSDKNGNSSLPHRGYLQDGQPMLYIANPDLQWAAQFGVPRLGTGAFTAQLNGLWKALTNAQSIPHGMGGKPNEAAYRFAEQRLVEQAGKMYPEVSPEELIPRVYMIGDNPLSDISGANRMTSNRQGRNWLPCLVRSGVWSGERPTSKIQTPFKTVNGVLDAVQAVLNGENWNSIKEQSDATSAMDEDFVQAIYSHNLTIWEYSLRLSHKKIGDLRKIATDIEHRLSSL